SQGGDAQAGALDSPGHNRPLGLPAPCRTLMLLHHRRQKTRNQSRQAMRGGQRQGAAHRIAFVRHGGGAAPAAAAGLTDFGNLILREQNDVTRHLTERSAEHSAGAKQCGRAVTVGVPRSVGTAELQLIGERGSYARSIFSKGGKGSGGAAELEDQRICESGGEPLPAALDSAEPSGSFEAEGDGRRSLKQGSSQNYGAAMLLREAPQSLFQLGQTAVKNRPRFLGSRTIAVSQRSWLVAPQCTKPAA